jgi:predicted porin
MKHKLLLGLGAALVCSSALAQSSVTLYGVIDESIRYQSHPMGGVAGNGSTIGLSEGTISGTRFGFKGSEDLGGGTQAIFDLQSG